MSGTAPQTVGFCVFRPDLKDDEIVVEIDIPPAGEADRRRLSVALTPADLALALTGRGGVKGRLFVYELPKAVKT